MQQDMIDESQSVDKTTQTDKKRPFAQLVSYTVMLGGLGWVVWLLSQDGSEILDGLSAASSGWFLLSLLFGLLSIAPTGFVFYIILNVHQADNALTRSDILRLHFVGQIIRHLPGRFWGVVYQINEIRHKIDPIQIIKVNIDFTLIYLIFNVLFALSVVVFIKINLLAGLLLYLLGVVIVGISLRFDWFYWGVSKIAPWLPAGIKNQLANYLALPEKKYPKGDTGKILLLLTFAWGMYLLAWQSFAGIYPALENSNLFLLCAAYTAAWVVGFASMITPSGWGVREAAFVFLSLELVSAANLGFLTLFVRGWLLLIDILLGLIFFSFYFFRKQLT